ncbi:conserved unknown protein [Ectocarpus siliculosus]|uniref:DUF4139 domain-containing protein n=1 Tax=Ectocarpus siliculosus TaxID=2880 RepID=D8LRN7_ECTSI|nr:conserved unknown protein [Ectocarpus siliculosus]|eukprot:CBN77798.1 conserved unknown protein [Ectocarpus siliculosus]
MATETAPPPSVPGADAPKAVSFSSSDAPIQAVTVFRKGKAEVTRIINFSSPSSLGRHEVELADLPRSFIDQTSVRVTGSGHCTILNVSYSEEPPTLPTQEERDAAKARGEKRKQDIQRLTNELTILSQQCSRNVQLRWYADRFAMTTTAGGSANAAATPGVSNDGPGPKVEDVGKALDWWTTRAVQTDAEQHRLELERQRLTEAIAELQKPSSASNVAASAGNVAAMATKKPGRILITVDVQELGNIELEVKYMTRGASWSPSYDLRVDTQTDSVSCTYYGMVTQSTSEDWQGVSLRLSTAEPTVHGTPPALGSKTLCIKTVQKPEPSSHARSRRRAGLRTGAGMEELVPMQARFHAASGAGGAGGGHGGSASVPPPPPRAIPATAQVEGGGRFLGAVSFAVEAPADIKSNGQMKKLTVGELQLSVEVTHYIVPAKAPAAYLQAKATNNTDYLLLASNNVSIFFDNSFVTKTSLSSVSPGESFQTFLGIDPAVKITVAPPRKTSTKRGIISKSNHVTHTHSTLISNTKKVPVTCVVVDAMPRSTDDVIKVTLKEPLPASVSECEAITDDSLVSVALEMYGGGEGNINNNTQRPPATPAGSLVTGVMKSPSNHLAWVGKIAPQGGVSIPLKYTVEWPFEKEIETLFG